MKKLNLISFLLLFLTTSSFGQTKDVDNIKRDDVLGNWVLTKSSLQSHAKKGSPSHEILIKNFHLNADSTFTFVLQDSVGRTVKSTKWTWKPKSKLLSLSLKCDVLIETNIKSESQETLYFLTLSLNKKDRKTVLEIGDLVYEK